MPKLRGERKLVLFADASVIVAATLSPNGGSFRLFQESSCGNVLLATNHYALDEAAEAIRKKYPQHISRLKQLISWSQIKIFKYPSQKVVFKYLNLINAEDAPILAGAAEAKAQFLLTLDRKDFLTNALQQSKLPFVITTPRDFFQQYHLF
ncbi:MAG: hypothetical protein AAB642_00855 [Patescibacteria group bacterium]|mgnify:CR=1 FL=1